MKVLLAIFWSLTTGSLIFAAPLKGKWIGDSGSYGEWHLDFVKPGVVHLIFDHMDGSIVLPARYELDADGRIRIFDFGAATGEIEQSSLDEVRNIFSKGNCLIRPDNDSVTNLWVLTCNNGAQKFWDINRLVPADARRKIGNLEVVTTGVRSGKTITCTRLRAMPSVDSGLIIYLPEDQSGSKNCAPAGTTLTVLARTPAKAKLGNAENFWYYIAIGHRQRAWVFGDLIKF